MAREQRESRRRILDERAQEFLRLFSMEAQQVRDKIASDLPAYNSLLSIRAESFEEVTLRQIAEEQNIPYDKNNPPKFPCPHCGRSDRVRRKEAGMFICRACGKSFAANHNSISSGTKCDALTWMKLLHCLLESYSLKRTCEYCGIRENTYYNLRNRLFYAMKLLLSDLKLYGLIEVDNTFVRTNYKGLELEVYDYPEDSPFYEEAYKPRAARKRGASYSNKEKNANHICIFTAVDDHGHAIARFAGIGGTSHRTLLNYVPPDLYLLSVPEIDPFMHQRKDCELAPKISVGAPSHMVADRETAIERYAGELGIEFESHVYRDKYGQRKLHASAHHIQHVNALHKRLKDFLRNSHYVSSKYLPGYLTLFEFIENTGASQEAIGALFRILATPNLGRDPSFFQQLFTVPNHLQEWLNDDNPLKKLPSSKLLAFYLYDQIRSKEDSSDPKITMKEIEEETGYTASSIRKNYRELVAAGYREMIIKHFEPGPKRASSAPVLRRETFNPVVLAIYDDYAKHRQLPPAEQTPFESFLDMENKKYNTNYKRTNMLMKFKLIERKGVREPLPPLPHAAKAQNIKLYAQLANEYDELILSYRQKGETLPKATVLYRMVGSKYNISPETCKNYITQYRTFSRRNKANNEHCTANSN